MFGSSPMAGAAGGAGGSSEGPGLELIQTEGLGFLALAGDAKVQLTPKWANLPAPTASLISIASRKGLVAAAGPEAVFIATTASVRQAFQSPKAGESEIRQFQAQVRAPLPVRISQLAFTADEQYLVLSAETGGGLAVYDVQSLSQGSIEPAFQLPTNGENLRALVPNPMPDKAELCAIVTTNGNLMMANLKEQSFVSGPNGQVLKAQVSCTAWSSKGKQLVAGSADGSVFQMTPDGQEKAHIPKPPQLGDYHVATVSWLENDVFLLVHNPSGGSGQPAYHIATRQAHPNAAPSFVFQKLNDPVEPFGGKTPHHSILRLREFPPNLQDLLIVSSTAVENIGLLTRSKTPLTSNAPADKITNVFTTTELADDSKRAQVPMAEDFSETFAIGTALDLSGKDKVYKPIPTDEMTESPGPLPALWVLNNEGVLASWWIVYNESIRQGTTYPGLLADRSAAAASSPKPSSAFGALAGPAATKPAFGGATSLGQTSSPWANAAASTTPTKAPAFGAAAFGSAAASGSPKFGAPSFGTPSFGKPPAAPTFGQSTTIGSGFRSSPWTAGSAGSAAPAFGQSAFASPATPSASPFANATTSPSGGFAGFANKGGFASLGANPAGGGSIFGSAKPSGSFASATQEVSMDTNTAFPSKPKNEGISGTSNFGASPFVLGTTFKADPASANDNEKPSETGKSVFSNFGFSLGGAASAEIKDEDMDAPTPLESKQQKSMFESTTPTTTPAAPRFLSTTAGDTPTSGAGSSWPKPSGSLFGPPLASLSERETKAQSPKIKQEEEEGEIFEAPLPPDTISKAVFPLGESSSSSSSSPLSTEATNKPPSNTVVDDAPLPPDPFTKPKQLVPENAPLPPDTVGQPRTQAVTGEAAPLPPDPFMKPRAKPTETTPLQNPFTMAKKTASDSVLSNPFADARNSAAESALPNPFAKYAKAPPVSSEQSSEGELSEEGEVDEDEEEEGSDENEQEQSDDGEEDEDEGLETGSEGSGIDVAKDLSPTNSAGFAQTPAGLTPQSSFAGVGDSVFSTTSRAEQLQASRLFGEVGRQPQLPPPQQASPESPSPTRNNPRAAIPARMLGSEATRSVSAPGMASQILNASNKTTNKAVGGFGTSIFARGPPAQDVNSAEQRKIEARREAEEARVLVDEDYELVEKQLDGPMEPTLQMAECVFLGATEVHGGSSIASQTEAVYRDINRMVLSLKMNARNLGAFIAGHLGQDRAGQPPQSKEDLENLDEWILCDLAECGKILAGELAQELEDGRVKRGEEAVELCEGLLKQAARLHIMRDDMMRAILARTDPDQVATARALPLSAEQAAQHNELRRSFTSVSSQLGDVEQALTLLKARIVTISREMGRGGATAPTVEAIMRTIGRMTAMVEKRSGDIDVLEIQMRKLGLGPGGRDDSSSPFATPKKRGSIFSPSSARKSLTSSVTSLGGARATPPRKKLSGYSDQEKTQIRQKLASRNRTLESLREGLAKNGPVYLTMDDD